MAKQYVPANEFGITYPIIASGELPPLGIYNDEHGRRIAERHHSRFPTRMLHQLGTAGEAERDVRLEHVLATDHNEYQGGLHAYYEGVEPFENEDERLRYVVHALSGQVPEYGLDFSGAKPNIVRISDDFRKHLWMSGRLAPASLQNIRLYLQESAIERGIEHIPENLIDKFLHTPIQDRREELAHNILAMMTEVAYDPLRNDYARAWNAGYLALHSCKEVDRQVKRRIAPTRLHLRRVSNVLLEHSARRFRVLQPERYGLDAA